MSVRRYGVFYLRYSIRCSQADVTFNDDREQTYTCVYTPGAEGEYRVVVRFSGREVPGSPFRVRVADQPGDASKVTINV